MQTPKMTIDLESALVAFAMIGAIILLLTLFAKRRKRSKNALSHRIAGESVPLPFTIPAEGPPRLSAADVLSHLKVLREKNAQWDAILSDLNPTDDAEVQRLLLEIRGPHLFVPHVGLSVIEEGCRKVLAVSPNPDALDALRAAVHKQEPFVR